MATTDACTITLNDVRFSYCNVFQPKPPKSDPNGTPKYSVTILSPMPNAANKALIDQAVNHAIDKGVANPKIWNGVRPPAPSVCVHDGNQGRPSDGAAYGDECKDCWVFTASSIDAPFVVDGNLSAIIDPREIYSGVYGNVSVTFYPYSSPQKKGIGCALNGIQKTRDGEPLGGFTRITAEDAFQPVPQSDPAAAGYGTPQQQQPAYQPQQQQPAYSAPAGYPQQAYPQQPVQGYQQPAAGYQQQTYPAYPANDALPF